jgi:hypothetical protein
MYMRPHPVLPICTTPTVQNQLQAIRVELNSAVLHHGTSHTNVNHTKRTPSSD